MEPALLGPTKIILRSSTPHIDPPPAPTSTISITGMRNGMPLPGLKRYSLATSNSRAVLGSASSSRQIFAVVPPMSNETIFSRWYSRAILLARTAPPAGPDSTMRMGYFIAVSKSERPPFESIKNRGQLIPISFNRLCMFLR